MTLAVSKTKQRDYLKEFLAREHVQPRFADKEALVMGGIFEEVKRRLTEASLCVNEKIREIFGWPVNGGKAMTDSTHLEETYPGIWRELTNSDFPFAPSSSSATDLIDPVDFYLQKLVANVLFGRNRGKYTISELDFFCLVAFKKGVVPDYASLIITHWESLKTKDGPIAVGGLVTYLLKGLHRSAVKITIGTDYRGVVYLDEKYLRKMKAVKPRNNGKNLAWTYHSNVEYHVEPASPEEPVEKPTKRRRQTYEIGSNSGLGSNSVNQLLSTILQTQLQSAYNVARWTRDGQYSAPRAPPEGWTPLMDLPPPTPPTSDDEE